MYWHLDSTPDAFTTKLRALQVSAVGIPYQRMWMRTRNDYNPMRVELENTRRVSM